MRGQAGTVWKDTRKLATASAAAAVALLNGQTPKTTGTVKNGSKNLPAFIIAPQTITKANYKLLFTQGVPEEEQGVRRHLRQVLQVDDAVGGGSTPPPTPHR